MNPADFTLQHADIPQPVLLDIDPVTNKWPMPPAKPWAPVEQKTLARVWSRIEDELERLRK